MRDRKGEVLDSNSRTHYLAVVDYRRTALQGGERLGRWYGKGLDLNVLRREARSKLHCDDDRATVMRVSGGVGLTYRIDADQHPVGIRYEVIYTMTSMALTEEEEGEDGK